MPEARWRRDGLAWMADYCHMRLRVQKVGENIYEGKIDGETVITTATLNSCIRATEGEASKRNPWNSRFRGETGDSRHSNQGKPDRRDREEA